MAQTIDNGDIPDELITFDADKNHFFRGNTDITDELPLAEKNRLSVNAFDVTRYNYELSARSHGGKYGDQPLPTSTLGLTVENLVTDPFSAPIDSLSNTANKFFGASGVIKLLLFGALIFAAYIFIQGGWFRRR
jgi:hypothetical protein